MRLLLATVLTITLATPPPAAVALKIPQSIALKDHEIPDLPVSIITKGGYDRIEIVIYYFSQGIEKFSYSENNTMDESLMKGEIKALVKLKTKNTLRKALFIAATGSSREQMLRNFSRTVKNTLAGL